MHADPVPDSGSSPVVVIGAGPAGLTAALTLHEAGLHPVVLEKDSLVGGLARTVCYKGYRFDIGGHRFFTKVAAVNRFWQEILPADLMQRKRLSRIYYNGKYFDYPLRPWNALCNLGAVFSFRAAASYAMARLTRHAREESLEDWLIHRFGRVLYRTFFKVYTEKVWGTPCSEIAAEWAEQRIRGLSLSRAMMAAFVPGRARNIKTLAAVFHYPRLGPGQMWDAVRARLSDAGHRVLTNTGVRAVRHDGSRVLEVVGGSTGDLRRFAAAHVISSMPLGELVERLDPPAPAAVLEAARALRYRDFLTVALIVDRPDLFPDNWLYIHDPSVRVGRIQNFGNWSPDMVPNREHSCLGMEYFCLKGDSMWGMNDTDLLALASREVSLLRLAPSSAVLDGTVVRMEKAYPVYDLARDSHLRTIREYLDGFRNLHPVGRNGMHKYNNQDHSMLTAMLAVRNILGERHDLWSVNADCEYHEESGR